MKRITLEYVESLNWKVLVNNDECIIWDSDRFELTYYKNTKIFFLHIDDDKKRTIGDTRIDYIEELQLYLDQFGADQSMILNTKNLLGYIKSNSDFIPIPSNYKFSLEPFNTPLFKAVNSEIVILHDPTSDEIEFMFNDLRTEFLILNKEMFKSFYNFYKDFEL